MELKETSFTKNVTTNSSSTPDFTQDIGQGTFHYMDAPGFNDICVGLLYYQIFDWENVEVPLGKGGKKYKLDDPSHYQTEIVSIFDNIYVNNIHLPKQKFIMYILKELDEQSAHYERRQLKFHKNAQYNGKALNENCFNAISKAIGCTDEGSWIILDVNIITERGNAPKLNFNALVVDKSKGHNFSSVSERNAFIRRNVKTFQGTSSDVESQKSLLASPLDLPYQSIFYGTPGTGKSHTAKLEEAKFDKVFRTTFHPEYDYASFVGCYKPKTDIVDNTKVIIYDFDPQVFTKAYEYAWSRPEKKVLLLIEEINRGNCAQIFGDLFQLLDRDNNGVSKYPINVDLDMLGYLKSKLQESHPEAVAESQIKLPGNFYIIATMNTSDQSLFPMDSAFKRRWVWKYFPITEYTQRVFKIKIAGSEYKWWDFIQEVNKRIESVTMSPDKQIGYWFINPESNVIESEEFVGKVLFYLWNDVFKDYPDNNDSPFVNIKFKDMFKVDGSPCEDTIIKFMQGLNLMNNNERNTIPFTSSEQALPLAAEPLAED